MSFVRFIINGILDRRIVGNTEVDFFGAGFGDGKTSSASIGDFAGFNVVDDDIKFDIFNRDGFVHFFGDFINNFNIDTLNFAAIIEFEWGKESVSLDDIIGGFDIFGEEIGADASDDDN